MNFGIILNSEGKIINHRSFVKVMFNPILRRFGIQIGTNYNIKLNKLDKCVFCKCPKTQRIRYPKYKLKKGETIIKDRRFI